MKRFLGILVLGLLLSGNAYAKFGVEKWTYGDGSDLNEGEIFNYSITDLNGKQVNTGVVNSSLTTINTKLLAEGLYVLKLQSGYRTITKKIVVKK